MSHCARGCHDRQLDPKPDLHQTSEKKIKINKKSSAPTFNDLFSGLHPSNSPSSVQIYSVFLAADLICCDF